MYLVAVLAMVGWHGQVFAQEATPVRLISPALQNVRVNDSFWSPKYKVWREVTIKDCLDKFEKDGTLTNFDHVASGELTAKHGGEPWFDGLLYEMIQGRRIIWPSNPTRH